MGKYELPEQPEKGAVVQVGAALWRRESNGYWLEVPHAVTPTPRPNVLTWAAVLGIGGAVDVAYVPCERCGHLPDGTKPTADTQER